MLPNLSVFLIFLSVFFIIVVLLIYFFVDFLRNSKFIHTFFLFLWYWSRNMHIMILLIFVSSYIQIVFISIRLIRPWLTSDIKHFNFCFVCIYWCLCVCECVYVCDRQYVCVCECVCVLALNSYTLPLKISLQFIPEFWDIGVNWWVIFDQQNMNFNLCLRVLFNFRWFSFSFFNVNILLLKIFKLE